MRRILLLTSLAACAAPDAPAPPVLTVTAPERGTLAEGDTVTVHGTVSGDGVRVTVNGLAADVEDGAFALTFAVPPGVEVIETIATGDGGEDRDVRAILTGTLAPTGAPVADAIAARLGPDAFAVIADVAAATIEGLDLAALAGAGGPPLVSVGSSCNGADVHLLDLALDDLALSLAPGDGAVDAAVAVDGLELKLRVDYRLGCSAQVAPITIRAAHVGVTADLGLAADGGDLASSIGGVAVTLDGLALDADGLPGEILDLVEPGIEAIAPGVIEAVVADALPAAVDGMLRDLAGRELGVTLLDRHVGIELRPASVAIDAAGARIALDAAIAVDGDTAGRFLATPAPADAALAGARDATVAIADDTINQLFAGLWASGALAIEHELEVGDPLGLLLGAETRHAALSMALPPTVAVGAGGELRLVIGDAIVRLTDAAGVETSTIAVSFATTLGVAAGPGGRIELALGEPEVWAQVLSQAGDLERPIADESVRVLVHALWDVASPHLAEALAAVPVPALGGVEMVEPAVAARAGFVILDTNLRGR